VGRPRFLPVFFVAAVFDADFLGDFLAAFLAVFFAFFFAMLFLVWFGGFARGERLKARTVRRRGFLRASNLGSVSFYWGVIPKAAKVLLLLSLEFKPRGAAFLF
jgi:hypothetical protein